VNVFIPSFGWSVTTDRHVGNVCGMYESYDCVRLCLLVDLTAPCGARGTVAYLTEGPTCRDPLGTYKFVIGLPLDPLPGHCPWTPGGPPHPWPLLS